MVYSKHNDIALKNIDGLIDEERAHHDFVMKQLYKMREAYIHSATSAPIETTARAKKSFLQRILTDTVTKEDWRIKIDKEKRIALVEDFLRLKEAGALSEEEIGKWLCAEFQGFVPNDSEVSVTPRKIGFENLRFFLRSIYLKYDGENRNKMGAYRDMIKRTHFYKNMGEHMKKHFADPKPKKYPEILELEY